MKDSVRAAFVSYSKSFEGCLVHPYLDVKRLVTVGIGSLVDDPAAFGRLPFQIDGQPATAAQIAAGYAALKASKLDPRAGGVQYASVTPLRLTDDAITNLTVTKLAQDEAVLMTLLPGWVSFPADGQLGILSMDWALGAYYPRKWPKFAAACNAGRWDIAAQECQPSDAEMKVQNKSFHDRVASWHTLFANAAAVVAQCLDPNVLHYPAAL